MSHTQRIEAAIDRLMRSMSFFGDPKDRAPAANALWTEIEAYGRSRMLAERDRWREVVAIEHDFAGHCPDVTQPDARDPECPACAALMKLEANHDRP